jgi:hypothetical protein
MTVKHLVLLTMIALVVVFAAAGCTPKAEPTAGAPSGGVASRPQDAAPSEPSPETTKPAAAEPAAKADTRHDGRWGLYPSPKRARAIDSVIVKDGRLLEVLMLDYPDFPKADYEKNWTLLECQQMRVGEGPAIGPDGKLKWGGRLMDHVQAKLEMEFTSEKTAVGRFGFDSTRTKFAAEKTTSSTESAIGG